MYELEAVKRAGAVAAARIEVMTSSATDHLIRTSNWLGASLLAVNGGGAIASLNVADRFSHPAIVGGIFVGGITFALLNAVAIQAVLVKQSGPLENWLAYWRGVEFSGERDEDAEKALLAAIVRWNRWSWVAPALGWVSGFLFLAGSISVGVTYQAPARPVVSAQ